MDEKEKRELLDWLNEDEELTPPATTRQVSAFSTASDPIVEPPSFDDSDNVLAAAPPPPPAPEVEEEEPPDAEALPEEGDEDAKAEVLDEGEEDELDARDDDDEGAPEEEKKAGPKWKPDFQRLTTKLAESAAAARKLGDGNDLSVRASAVGAKMKSSFQAFGRKVSGKSDAPPKAGDDDEPAGMFSIGDDDDDVVVVVEKPPMSAPSPARLPPPDPAALALAQHKIAGLQKGQTVVFDSNNLPDTVLFSAIKLKPMSGASSKIAGGLGLGALAEKKLVRCIAVNRERLLVFDTRDQPVKFGATATVKSNHHLTELVKLTFPRARERDVVAMHIRAGASQDGAVTLKANTYKVPRAQSLIKQLQERLARFR